MKITLKRIFLTSLIVILVSVFLFQIFSSFTISAANVLNNPSFTGGSTGWTLSGGASYDSTIYQDSAGSLKGSSTGRKSTTTGTGTQNISGSITAGSTVYLNLYWAKQCVAVNCEWNDISVEISENLGAYQTVWSDTSNPAFGSMTSWTSVSNYNISSYFVNGGAYQFRISFNLRTGNNGSAAAYAWFDNLNLDVIPPNITVGTTGTQVSTIQQGDPNMYIGGAFTFVRNTGSTSVTSITVSDTGTISDANLSGLILYYKQEATCSSSIPGDATVFNSTPGSFSSGSSTVTGSMTVGTSQICVYAEVDIGSGAAVDDTVDLQITNPSTQVIASAGNVSPGTAIAISGTTTIVASGNHPPSFTNFTENGPVNPGSTVTFTAIASDTDADNIFMVVCKTAGVTGVACDGGAGDTWCTSSSVASNPSCQYSTPSVYPDGIYNVYPYIFDSNNEASQSSFQGAEFSYTVNNVAPVVSTVTINGGTAINLEESTTKAVTLTATVTDNNSCFGGEIASVLGYMYRSGVGYTGCDTAGEANNNYCYPEVSCTVVGGTCTDNTDASANYTCTVNLQYYADPTDDNTQYPTESWMDTIKAIDDDTSSHTSQVSAGVELNSLVAFDITASVNYGTLGVGQSNSPLDKITTITPTGNVGLDNELSGPANMCTDFPTCSGATIPIGNQKYSLLASTSYPSATSLTTSAVEAETDIPKATSGSPTTANIWWGMLVPMNTSPGSYNGNINVTGIKAELIDWPEILNILAPTDLQMERQHFYYISPATTCTIDTTGSAIFQHEDTGETGLYYQLAFNYGGNGGVKRAFTTPVPEGSRSETFAISGTFPDNSFSWRIKMWDSLDNESPLSTTILFHCCDKAEYDAQPVGQCISAF